MSEADKMAKGIEERASRIRGVNDIIYYGAGDAAWDRSAAALLREQAAEIARLREALTDVLSDIADYERVNNLAPAPSRQDCWQSVARARAALEGK